MPFFEAYKSLPASVLGDVAFFDLDVLEPEDLFEARVSSGMSLLLPGGTIHRVSTHSDSIALINNWMAASDCDIAYMTPAEKKITTALGAIATTLTSPYAEKRAKSRGNLSSRQPQCTQNQQKKSPRVDGVVQSLC